MGENIFKDGDFGSGTANVLQTDPKIAPGYVYSRQVPPNDGSYVITNNTNWPTLFPTWIKIKDKSNDPYGYMMVINASDAPGIFYEQTIQDLCENTLYEFSADIINIVRNPVTLHTLPNVSFLLDGVSKFNTGGKPQSEQWNTVGFLFSTTANQTSLKLSLRNNAPGGIGNDLALDNISFRACGPKATILTTSTNAVLLDTVLNICEDGNPIDLKASIQGTQFKNPAIQWQVSKDGKSNWTDLGKDSIQKHTLLKSGLYFYRYLLASTESNLANVNCRLVSTTKVIQVRAKFYTIRDTLCEGGNYFFGKRILSTPGTYIDSLTSSIGCDSILTLHLVIVPDQKIKFEKKLKNPSFTAYKDGNIVLSSISSGYSPFAITLNNNSITGTSIGSLAKGKYGIQIKDRYGCMVTDSFTLVDPPPFKIKTDSIGKINLGTQILLHIVSNQMIQSSTYYFENNQICNQNCENRLFLPFRSSNLKVHAVNNSGCLSSDSTYVLVDDNIAIYIPNIFTPNEDGQNDVFIPLASSNLVKGVISFQIYNRYGGIMYAVKNNFPYHQTIGWDGKIKNRKAEEGVYLYQIRLQLINDRIVNKTGEVLLMR